MQLFRKKWAYLVHNVSQLFAVTEYVLGGGVCIELGILISEKKMIAVYIEKTLKTRICLRNSRGPS